MKYLSSRSIFGISKDIINEFDKKIISFISKEFVFQTKDFDQFILVLNYFPEQTMDEMGDDRLQVSKKEKTIFLGVKIYNEVILNQKLSFEEKLNYHFKRIIEVKEQNLLRLIKNGLIVNSSK